MKVCPSCGRTYSDIVQRCGVCNTALSMTQAADPNTQQVDYAFFAEKGNITEGSYLRGYSGNHYKIGKLLGEGGEGTVYFLQTGNSVAKIYKKDIPNQEAKLRFMVDHNIPNKDVWGDTGSVSLAWPTDVLYDRDGVFVGYVMPKVANGIEIFEIARGNSSERVCKMFPGYNWMLNLKVALNLAAAVAHIHSYNVVIGDMNCKNILVNPDHSITILDCDSFDITDPGTGTHYKCGAATEDYLAPELQGRNLRDESAVFSKHTDEFALAVHIFQLLMDNRYPFTGIKFEKPKNSQAVNARLDNVARGLCPYIKSNTGIAIPPGAPVLDEVLPDILIRDFVNTFSYDETSALSNAFNRTSASTWAEHLQAFYKGTLPNVQLNQCSANSTHVFLAQKGFCGFCAAEQRFKERVSASNTGVANTSGTSSTTSDVPENKKTISKWIYGIVAAVILIAVCVFNSDSYKLYSSYSSAKSAFDNKQFSVAAEKFKSLGNYKDSNEMYLESLYQSAGAFYNNRQYDKAAVAYNKVLGYKDSKKLRQSAMVYYIDSHMSSSDFNTYMYMQELKGNAPSYFDWKAKYKAIYSWKVTILNVSQSEDDYATNSSRNFVNGEKHYVHFKLSGGDFGGKTRIKVVTYNRGFADSYYFEGESRSGSTPWFSFWNYYGDIDMYFYDAEGNQIGHTYLNAI